MLSNITEVYKSMYTSNRLTQRLFKLVLSFQRTINQIIILMSAVFELRSSEKGMYADHQTTSTAQILEWYWPLQYKKVGRYMI